eukprot:sb/3463973/
MVAEDPTNCVEPTTTVTVIHPDVEEKSKDTFDVTTLHSSTLSLPASLPARGFGCHGLVVLATLCLSCVTLNLNTYMGSSFFVTHFTGRNVSGTIYGLIGSGVGIGCGIAPLFELGLAWILSKMNHTLSQRQFLFGSVIAFLLASCGFAALDMITNKDVFAMSSLFVRILLGVLTAFIFRGQIDCVRLWFPGKFVLVNSLVTGTSGYVGVSVASATAGPIYNQWGFHAPYLFGVTMMSLSLLLSFFLLPRDKTPIIPEVDVVFSNIMVTLSDEKVKIADEETKEEVEEIPTHALSPLIFLPLFGQLLMNSCGAYILFVTVPYLESCCNVPMAYGSLYTMIYPVAVACGYFIGGFLADKQVISLTKQGMSGCLAVCFGMFLAYYSPGLDFLYNKSHVISWLGMVLAGVGDPVCTCICLKLMEHLQTNVLNRGLTAKQKSLMDTLWVLGWNAGSSGGFLLAGVLLQITTLTRGSWVMASLAAAGTCIFFLVTVLERVVWRRRSKMSEDGV